MKQPMVPGSFISHRWILALLCVVPGALILMSAAFYNGYPLAFPDSGDYVHRHGTPMRVGFYALFTTPLRETGSTWPFVAVHALLVSYLIYLMLRARGSSRLAIRFFNLVCLLTLLSSVSWYVSFLMPDIFSAIAILCVYLFMFKSEQLSAPEQRFLVVLLVASCLFHLSNPSYVLGLCAALTLLKLIFRMPMIQWTRLAILACVVASALGLHVARTQWVYGVSAPSAASYVYPLSALVRTGLLKNYLDEACQLREYKICPYRDQFPKRGDEFIFLPDSPLHKVGGYLGYREEGSRLVREAILYQPVAVLRKWAELTGTQLRMVNTARWTFGPMAQLQWPTRHFEKKYPAEIDSYRNSRQNLETLPFPKLSTIHEYVIAGSLVLALVIIALRLRRSDSPSSQSDLWLLSFTLLALIIAAAGSGFPSGDPAYRHMAKVVWILPMAVGVVMLSNDRFSTSREPSQNDTLQPQPENYDEGSWIT